MNNKINKKTQINQALFITVKPMIYLSYGSCE